MGINPAHSLLVAAAVSPLVVTEGHLPPGVSTPVTPGGLGALSGTLPAVPAPEVAPKQQGIVPPVTLVEKQSDDAGSTDVETEEDAFFSVTDDIDTHSLIKATQQAEAQAALRKQESETSNPGSLVGVDKGVSICVVCVCVVCLCDS